MARLQGAVHVRNAAPVRSRSGLPIGPTGHAARPFPRRADEPIPRIEIADPRETEEGGLRRGRQSSTTATASISTRRSGCASRRTSIVVLGGLGSVSGSLIAAFVVGYLETITAYLISPAYRTIPALLLLVVVMYIRPQGLLGRR